MQFVDQAFYSNGNALYDNYTSWFLINFLGGVCTGGLQYFIGKKCDIM